ncbi:MAG: DMT family transporter [Syntrophomonadaceae bacterium]|nr:DMT family transporter [Syntrophomonadaceae bacterium]
MNTLADLFFHLFGLYLDQQIYSINEVIVLSRLSDSILGAIYIFISAFAYATQTILGKYAFAAGLNPESLLILRFAFTSALLTPYLLLMRIPVIDKSPLVLIQALLFAVEGIMFFYALSQLSASITIVIFFCHPVLVAIMGSIIFKEKLHLYFIWGLLLAVSGVTLVSGVAAGLGQLSPLGLLLIIGSALSYTIYSLISQNIVVKVSPLSITNTLTLGSLLVLLLLFHDLSFLSALTIKSVALVLLMTVLNTLIAVVFFLKGVQKLGAARATLLGTLEPVLAVLLAFTLLNESLSPIQFLGAGLVFLSIFLAVYPSSPKGEKLKKKDCI